MKGNLILKTLLVAISVMAAVTIIMIYGLMKGASDADKAMKKLERPDLIKFKK